MVDAVTPNQDYYLPDKNNYTKEKPGGLSDPNTFLKILVAQMKYQNPMEPSSSETFINQLTQMATMEQMANVSTSMNNLASKYEMSRYYELIGQQVTVLEGDQLVSGKVGGVIIENEEPFFYLDGAPEGERYTLDQVKGVKSPQNNDILPHFALIGQYVKVDSEGGEVSGIVEKVLLNNGNTEIQIDGNIFNLSDILEILNPYLDEALDETSEGSEDNASQAESDSETVPSDTPEL